MANPVDAILILIGAAFAMGCGAAAMTFAVCLVCRWMEWAPINLTVNLNDHRTIDRRWRIRRCPETYLEATPAPRMGACRHG